MPPKVRDPGSTARFEQHTITRYRVALVREGSVPYDRPESCSNHAAAARFIRKILSDWDREVLGVLLLDTRGRAIGHQIAHIGTINRTAVEPRGVLTAALLAHATSIIVFHNHPSGDPTPSTEDLAMTENLRKAAEILGITLHDHIILGEDRWVSLRERGGW